MKKILLAAITLFYVNENYAQGTWTRKADFGGVARHEAVAFSIGNKGYVGTGEDQNFNDLNDFWEYNPATDSWTQKANFAGGPRHGAVGFGIGNKGYIGTGLDAHINRRSDFWEYDPVTNKWSRKANFGGTARYEAQGFAIGTKGYIGTGTDWNDPVGDTRDFWEYNPATNKWTRKADFGGFARHFATAFSIGNKGYLGIGVWVNYDRDEYDLKNDFWEYNPSANIWTRKADFLGGDWWGATGFSINGKGYIGTGIDANDADRRGLWAYDPIRNKWTPKAKFGGDARAFAAGFSVGRNGYIVTGGLNNDLWQYSSNAMLADAQKVSSDASAGMTTSLSCYPNPSRGSILVQYRTDISQVAQFAVRDIQGRIVFSKTELAEKGINTYHLNLNNLSSGTYFLQLANGQKERVTKIVINK
ncbi:MAG TPA: kelch repeat-containing protein [Chitinophagaceae bacterium]|jgi:N-acetylneuraminic acid mutarotase